MQSKALIKGLLRRTTAEAGRFLPHADPMSPRLLCYHEVSPQPKDEWSVTPEQLREHMHILTDTRNPVSVMQFVDWLRNGTALPEGAVAVTFDDGFLGVYEYAAPILSEFNILGTAFVSPMLVEDGTAAADSSFHAAGPFMNWEQLRKLHENGWTIGGHAMNHPQLSHLNSIQSREQIENSKTIIEDKLGIPCEFMAYPYGTPGTVSERERRFANEVGYEAAFMAITGAPRAGMDPFSIPRSKVLGSDSLSTYRATLSGALDIWRIIERSH